MSDHERRINLSTFYFFEEWFQITVHVGLSHFDRQTLVKGCAHGDSINETAVNFGATILLCHFQALWEAINRDDAGRIEHPGALDRKLTYRATTPNRNRIPRLNISLLSGHITGRENIREEEDLLITKTIFNFERTDIRKRHTDIFCLPARVATHQMRVAKNPGRG